MMNLPEVTQVIAFNGVRLLYHDFLLVIDLECHLKLLETYNASSTTVINRRI